MPSDWKFTSILCSGASVSIFVIMPLPKRECAIFMPIVSSEAERISNSPTGEGVEVDAGIFGFCPTAVLCDGWWLYMARSVSNE